MQIATAYRGSGHSADNICWFCNGWDRGLYNTDIVEMSVWMALRCSGLLPSVSVPLKSQLSLVGSHFGIIGSSRRSISHSFSVPGWQQWLLCPEV
jgi:hypothetical protein